MILTHLPPGPLHHAMEVSKDFRDTIKPTTSSSNPPGMRKALGLGFRRCIEDITYSESLSLAMTDDSTDELTLLYDLIDENIHLRFHWLLNVTLDPRNASARRKSKHGPVPTLATKPFHLVRIARGTHTDLSTRTDVSPDDESSETMTLNFCLPVQGLDTDEQITRGILKDDDVYPNNGSATWSGVKILTMPFDVRISVCVDFREAMFAPWHPVGHCRFPGCQVGDHGVQVSAEKNT